MAYTFERIWDKGIIFKGDCLEVMPDLIKNNVKVDAIITDVPYGTTACSWDTIIPFDKMWECLESLIKDKGVIALFGAEPFSSHLRLSNEKLYRYDWTWNKIDGSNFLQAKKQPLKITENISIFYKHQPTYNPIMELRNPKNKRPATKCHRKNPITGQVSFGNATDSDYKFPTSIITVHKGSAECNSRYRQHPTQKPIELMEYLIKTYTNESDLVLDFTMGSGSTLVACRNLNRKFIGIELTEQYYNIVKKRLLGEIP